MSMVQPIPWPLGRKKKKQNKFSRFIWNFGTRKQRFLFFYLSQRLFCPKNRELCRVECTRRARKTYALFRANSLVILKAMFGSYQTFRLLAKNGCFGRVFSEKENRDKYLSRVIVFPLNN